MHPQTNITSTQLCSNNLNKNLKLAVMKILNLF